MSRNLGNFLKAYMEFTTDTESPDAYHFWVGASLISAATRRQVYLDMNYFRIYPNMYVILIGPSGARKSIAASIGMGLAESVGIRKFSDKITGAALIRDLSEASEKRVDDKKGEVELCSPIMIYASELGVFMGPDAYGSGVIADLTDLYDCPNKWEKKTISRDSEMVVAPYVTMLAASTPQTLKDVIPTGAVGQGFTSRILFIWASGRRKKVPIPNWGVEHEAIKQNLIHDLGEISKVRGIFKFSSQGLLEYQRNYLSRPEPEEEFEDERLRGYASRKDIHTLKLAQIMSLSDGDSLTITEKEIEGAADAIRWLDMGLASVFSGHGGSASSEDIVRVFRQIEVGTNKVGSVRHADLLKRNYHAINAQEFGIVLQTLRESGAIEEIVSNERGNLVKMYRVLDRNFIKRASGVMPRKMRGDD